MSSIDTFAVFEYLNHRIIRRDTDINGFQHWLTDQISLDVSLKTAVEVATVVKTLTNAIHASGNRFTPQQSACTNRQQFLPLDLRRQIEKKEDYVKNGKQLVVLQTSKGFIRLQKI